MEILVERITKAINYAFKSDGTSPGLTISWIHHTGKFYTSIVRWVGGEKMVVCSAQGFSIEESLKLLSQKFLSETPAPINPIDELAEFLTEKGDNSEESLLELNSLLALTDIAA